VLIPSVVDPHHLDADPDSTYHPDAVPDFEFSFDADPDPIFHPDADPDLDPSIKKAKIDSFHTYILTSHMRIDVDLDPAFKFWCGSGFLFDVNADPDVDPCYQNDADR
jgi:hypothetical protein